MGGCLAQGAGWSCLECQSLESEAAIGGEAGAVLEVGPGAGQGAGQGLGPDMDPRGAGRIRAAFQGRSLCCAWGRGRVWPGRRAQGTQERGLVTRCWGGSGALESTVGPAQVSCAAALVEAVSCHSWGWGVLVRTCC